MGWHGAVIWFAVAMAAAAGIIILAVNALDDARRLRDAHEREQKNFAELEEKLKEARMDACFYRVRASGLKAELEIAQGRLDGIRGWLKRIELGGDYDEVEQR